MSDAITSFSGEFSFLSNFFPSEQRFSHPTAGFLTASTAEHAFAALKTLEVQEVEQILAQATPGRAKRAGREVTLRENWESEKIAAMAHVLAGKFWGSVELQKRLIATGESFLLEGNLWHDNFWGSCACEKCESIEGRNTLGRLLMELRTALKIVEEE